MASLFGFHGERPGPGGSGGFNGAMSTKPTAARRLSKKPSVTPTPSFPNMNNPMLKPPSQSNNMMTYNAMYSVASVTPPAINQRPSRKAASRGASTLPAAYSMPPQPINSVNNPNPSYAPPAPLPTPTRAPTPSASVQFKGIPTALNAPAQQISDLQAKVAKWKQRRERAGTATPLPQAPAPVMALPPPQRNQEDEEEEDEPEHDHHSQQQQHPSQPTPPSSQYQSEINLTVDSMRREIASLREELKSQQQAAVVKMVEQQVQKVVVEQNRVTNVLEQLQMMCRAQQVQMDDMTQQQHEKTENEALTPEELDELIDGLREEQKVALGALENEVKATLQKISDRSYWFYGVAVPEKVGLFESHELQSRQKGEVARGTKLALSYPMKKTQEGVWVKARTVGSDGTITVSWVPIWTFHPQVLAKYGQNQPPDDEEKIVYLGEFSMV